MSMIPERSEGSVSSLDEEQAHRILVEWTRTQEAYDRTETVWGLIESQAQARPEQTAIIDGEAEIGYRRLTERASAIAGELVARGVEPGSLVGVCMSRTWQLVATLVGVLRAGCTYVPLDPTYPRQRVRYMLEHARAVGAIVDHENMAELCAGVTELVRLDEVGQWTADGVAGPSASPSSQDLAYVIYTSGSTGRPKGVAVEHRSVVAMSRSMRKLLDDEELAGVLAAASVCFDPSVMEILGTLSLGGTVVLAENVLELLELPSADRVRTCIMVPSAMQALLAAGRLPEGIRCLVFGGEVLKRSLVDRLHALEPGPRVVNVYGPTEDTVYSTATEVSAGVETITIGKPVSNSRSYILNDSMQPVPVGIPGELYLAGDQLARGYLHDEELTKERFIEVDPTGPIAEERLYKTGDLCRWREDGEIEFLGRVDQQVKIRGFRVELEEIESTLESMAGVDGAAAAVVDGGGGQKMLVVYLVSRDEAVTSEAARAYLAERLPKYMLPQVVIHLEELPRLPNGKLDRKQLAKPEVSRGHDRRDDLAPHSGADVASDAGGLVHRLAGLSKDERHAALLTIIRGEIASLLRLGEPEQVPPDHPLDDLGLDSLTAVELSSRLAAITGRTLPASAAIEHLTPAAVAEYVLDSMGSATEHAPPGKARGGAADTLGSFQAQMRSSHPPFLAAKAPSWSATDKGTLVRELKRLVSRTGRDPYSKLLRTGSAHRGTVADAYTDEEREAIIWTTNLYLGLNRDQEVIEEAGSALERFGTGMGTSAAASGVTDLHLEFERAFAELVGKPAACLFPTGYTANLGVVAGLLGDDDVIVMDQLCHASIVDGARLCGATIRTFRHNDPSDLESVLGTVASPYRTVLVALESVYSMGEGAAPVAEIVLTAKKYDALVFVDEAHSFGFYGPRGAGLCAAQGATDQVDFIMTTLSKALGSLGGVVAAREEHVALLKSSARAYIFQATASPADIAAALAALRRLSADDALRERLWDTTTYMRQRFSAAGYDLGTGDGPIVTPHFSDKDKLFAIVHGLYERGVHTAAVTYPIVESGRGRLRFICSASHTREDVDRTLEALIDAEREAEEERQAWEDRVPGDGEGPSDAHPGRSGVEEWAKAFSAYLKETLARAPGPAPNLAVSVGLPDHGEAITIVIDERNVTLGAHETLGAHKTVETPFCSLLPTDDRAVSSLCSSDVQGLLHSICKGACVLNGQVEPFIWLIGRMADWQRDSSA